MTLQWYNEQTKFEEQTRVYEDKHTNSKHGTIQIFDTSGYRTSDLKKITMKTCKYLL